METKDDLDEDDLIDPKEDVEVKMEKEDMDTKVDVTSINANDNFIGNGILKFMNIAIGFRL